jgi:hypothetical protein
MPEMTHSGKQHRHSQPIRRINGFLIAHRSARLDYGRGPGFSGLLDAVGKREKRVGRKNTAREG